jgi:hypothetical protein
VRTHYACLLRRSQAATSGAILPLSVQTLFRSWNHPHLPLSTPRAMWNMLMEPARASKTPPLKQGAA